MYADEPFIGMRAASTYKFVIIGSPSGRMFRRKIKLFAETKYIRAADGGTGFAKFAGNYGAALLPAKLAEEKGYDQVLWLDAKEFKNIQECGTMNVMFVIDGTVITPPLYNTILDGVTRRSALEILRDEGYDVKERNITIDEIVEAYHNGKFSW